jgi:hypothetical protein
VSFTYKGFTGYAPIFAYLGEEGYLADVELRPGSTHCQNGTASFLKRSIDQGDDPGPTFSEAGS